MEDNHNQFSNDFSEIVNQYSGLLYRYAFWLTGRNEPAQDIVQETFLRAWKSFESLKNKASIKPWLITILRNENARRFEKKQLKRVDIEVENFEGLNTDEDNRAEAFLLRHAIDSMPDTYSEPLVLQILCGFSCEEIAGILDISTEAVMTRLYRARNQLRKKLGGQRDSSIDRGHS